MESVAIRRNTGYFFGPSAKLKKKYDSLTFWSTQDHMGLQISKRYSPYIVHPISAKLYEDIGYHGEYRLLLFFVSSHMFYKLGTLWNFNMIVNKMFLTCAIAWKRVSTEGNWWNFGTRGYIYCLCIVPFMSDFWVQFGSFSVLCTTSNVMFKRRTPTVSSISSKFYGMYGDQGEIQTIIFLAVCQRKKNYMALWI